MGEINLTKADLFLTLLENYVEGIYIDLHNCYKCEKMLFDKNENRFSFDFRNIEQAVAWPKVSIIFEDVVIALHKISFESAINELTLDNFYRGRFFDGKELKEYSDDGKGYFYIDFYEEISIEIFAGKVILSASQ